MKQWTLDARGVLIILSWSQSWILILQTNLDSDPDLQIPDPHVLCFYSMSLLLQLLGVLSRDQVGSLNVMAHLRACFTVRAPLQLSYCYCTNSTKLNVFVSLNTISYSASHFLANFSSLLCQILNAGCLQCRHLPIDFKICNFLDKLKFCQISVRDRFSAIL